MPGRMQLDESTFFKLVLIVNLTARPFGRVHQRVHGLSLTEWRVLFAVAGRSSVSASQVSEVLGMDKMAVSRAVRALESHGRIERRSNERDGRRSELHLTEVGRAVYAAIAEGGLAREEALLGGLSAEEKAELNRLLELLVQRARALPQDG